MSEQPLVITVILNTNRRDDTLECLRSLQANDYPAQQVIVLDNASTDGSADAIRAAFPGVEIIALEHNLGYAGNNNVGIRAALQRGAEWVFVLNEDTILAPDCITRLVEAGESDPRAGVTGPLVYHHDEPDVIQSAGGILDASWMAVHRGQNELDTGQYAQQQETDWISGCAILVRRAVIERVGPLDERFFYYWEETEWCLRAREDGWHIIHVPAARIWHKGVQREYRPGPNVTYYATRNRFLLLSKHHAAPGAWLRVWVSTLRTLASWTVRPRWAHMRPHRDALWQGMLDFLRGRYGMRSGAIQ